MKYIFYTLAFLFLFLGFYLAFKPIFVPPASRLRIKWIDDHDMIIHLAFSTCGFLIFLSIFLHSGSFDLADILSTIFVFILGAFIFVAALDFLLIVLVKLIKNLIILDFGKKNSIRSFYCQDCKKKLKQLKLLDVFLSEKEKVALKIKSIFFEIWHCPRCFPEINRDSIHLRAYVSESKKFLHCPECEEITMTKTLSRVIRMPTTKSEGEMLNVYTCQYCDEEEESFEIIPRERSRDGGGGGGGDGGGGGG